MNNTAVFASGAGTNAQRIIEHFSGSEISKVSILLTNNKNAGAIAKAQELGVPVTIFDRNDFYSSDKVLDILIDNNVGFIILAGFLWLIPENILKKFENRIINIHPALLPAYGGKGMYGRNVHEAVIAAGEKESGITIHYVNNEYDKGSIVFRASCVVDENETPDTLAEKIHALEYRYYPSIAEKLIKESI